MTEEQKQENRIRIGGQISAIRNKKGLSIRELAEACGVSFANIYKIENGKYNVSIDILGKICEALGYHVDIKPNMDEVIVTKDKKEGIVGYIGSSNTPSKERDGLVCVHSGKMKIE